MVRKPKSFVERVHRMCYPHTECPPSTASNGWKASKHRSTRTRMRALIASVQRKPSGGSKASMLQRL